MTGIVSAGVDEAGLLQVRQLTMILVIESGEIRESGTHDELLNIILVGHPAESPAVKDRDASKARFVE